MPATPPGSVTRGRRGGRVDAASAPKRRRSARRRRTGPRLRLPLEQLLGGEEVDPAVDQVQQPAHRALLLDLLLDEPLQELEAAVIRRRRRGAGERVELSGHAKLALKSGPDRLPGRGVPA